MLRDLIPRAALAVLLAYGLLLWQMPGIAGAGVSVKDAGVILVCVTYLGKLLYDTLFGPRGPWGVQP